jgi:hypothetical protein
VLINHYRQGTLEYKWKQKIIESQTKGVSELKSLKEVKELIRFAYTREGIPLRYTQMGAIIRVFPA